MSNLPSSPIASDNVEPQAATSPHAGADVPDLPPPSLDHQDLPRPAPSPPPSSESPPLVVIQYRSRLFPTLLLPPALILMAGAAIVSYRVQVADWPGLWTRTSPVSTLRGPSPRLASCRVPRPRLRRSS